MARKAEAAKPVIAAQASAEGHSWNIFNEVVGVVTLGAALFALVSFLSFHPGQRNLGGPSGTVWGISCCTRSAWPPT